MVDHLIEMSEVAVDMDDIDQALLSELRRDGRAAFSDLAARLGVARGTVRARMERLTKLGEISGFTVITRGDVAEAAVRGFMMIGIEGRGAERIMDRLAGFPEVAAVHSTNGRWDLIAEIGARTLEEFDNVLFQIRRLDGVMASETSLLLSTRRAGRR